MCPNSEKAQIEEPGIDRHSTEATDPACGWQSFLQRRPAVLDRELAAASLAGKRIMVTGGGGSIGSALTRTVAGFRPRQILVLEAAEGKLHQIHSELQDCYRGVPDIPILGSVSDPSLLDWIFRSYRPEIVYHAAAFKHVPLMEQNPFAAIENNAVGTYLLARAAADHGTEQLILLSTDKAVDPIGIMGASKRIAELVLPAHRNEKTRMTAVRLGNVLGSEGSIVPLFLKQILHGGPVTVTDREARRYFLTMEEAVALLLLASSAESPQGVLVPALGEPLHVEKLARYLIEKAPSPTGGPIPVIFTQLRPGDKMCEALLSCRESYSVASHGPFSAIESPSFSSAALDEIMEQLRGACRQRDLKTLLDIVLRAVPEYRPSLLLKEAAGALGEATA